MAAVAPRSCLASCRWRGPSVLRGRRAPHAASGGGPCSGPDLQRAVERVRRVRGQSIGGGDCLPRAGLR
eukprot:7735801-Pyramimonas_sp.AAC.1